MPPVLASIYRHPVKGFTPEPLQSVELVSGECFPLDRRWAVEVGPSGFDPAAPKHISKMKFTVLARFPQLARLKTHLAGEGALFHIGDEHGFGVDVPLDTEKGRVSLASFLQVWLGEEASAPLRVIEAPGHHFMDHPQGHVSLINLASVRAFEAAIGRPVDPLRFRANLYVDGLDPFVEDALTADAQITVGDARLSVVKPIVRCAAPDANTETGSRDIDVVALLREHFDRDTMGVYLNVDKGARIARGDAMSLHA